MRGKMTMLTTAMRGKMTMLTTAMQGKMTMLTTAMQGKMTMLTTAMRGKMTMLAALTILRHIRIPIPENCSNQMRTQAEVLVHLQQPPPKCKMTASN